MNPERILGALVRDALMGGSGLRHRRPTHRRSGNMLGGMLGPGMKGMLGMGALGVAIAAFDHYMKQKSGGGAQSFTGVPPAAPQGGANYAVPPPPPPPPRSAGEVSGSLPPLPPLPQPTPAAEKEAMLLIQAMIAAANCDYEIDADERGRILRTMEEAGLDESERKVLTDELEHPKDIASIAARATSPNLRRDVYLASEMAIDADTKAEQNYLARLARQLGLGNEEVAELKKILADAGAGAP